MLALFSLQGKQLELSSGDTGPPAVVGVAVVEKPPPKTDGRRFVGTEGSRPVVVVPPLAVVADRGDVDAAVPMTLFLLFKTRLLLVGDAGGTVAFTNPGGQDVASGVEERSRSQYDIFYLPNLTV